MTLFQHALVATTRVPLGTLGARASERLLAAAAPKRVAFACDPTACQDLCTGCTPGCGGCVDPCSCCLPGCFCC